MRALIYEANKCQIFREETTLESNVKPEFSFEYTSLAYDFLMDLGKILVNNELILLTDEQRSEVDAYIDTVQADEQEQLNLDSEMYLRSTDWYVVRKAETGVAIPMEILSKRAEAREAITSE